MHWWKIEWILKRRTDLYVTMQCYERLILPHAKKCLYNDNNNDAAAAEIVVNGMFKYGTWFLLMQ